MEIVTKRDVSAYEFLTPPLRPIAAALADAAVKSHCAACFSVLGEHTFPPFRRSTEGVEEEEVSSQLPSYCSVACSIIDSTIHFASTEHMLPPLLCPPESILNPAHLRLALRLVSVFEDLGLISRFVEVGDRIGGLLTNWEKIVIDPIVKIEKDGVFDDGDECYRIVRKIREYAKLMKVVRRKDVKELDQLMEEKVLCLVVTNALQVRNRDGILIGMAIYPPIISWTNNSCAPSSTCRFLIGGVDCPENSGELKIGPAAAMAGGITVHESEVVHEAGHGPRVMLRSQAPLMEGESVTIAYTDLLLCEDMRKTLLWQKYRFNCECVRCYNYGSAERRLTPHIPRRRPFTDEELANVYQEFRKVTSQSGDAGDAELCHRLETFICFGIGSDDLHIEMDSKPLLYKANEIYIKCYQMLSALYDARGKELLSGSLLEALEMFKTSAAYAFLHAMSVNEIFKHESAIMPVAASSYYTAGIELLAYWSRAEGYASTQSSKLARVIKFECRKCSSITCDDHAIEDQELSNCIAWIGSVLGDFLFSDKLFILEGASLPNAEIPSHQVNTSVMELAVHCIRYGAFLLNVCFGFPIPISCADAYQRGVCC